jgi:hypothetical protein
VEERMGSHLKHRKLSPLYRQSFNLPMQKSSMMSKYSRAMLRAENA